MKIGIFGGTFNPIHIAHLQVAIDVKAELGLDEIWFLCALAPPHKKDIINHKHRFNLIKLSIANYPNFFASDIEIKNNFFFSVDTLAYINNVYGKDNDFYFLIGKDAFFDMPTWKDYEKVFSMANFIVFNRFEEKLPDIEHLLSFLKTFLKKTSLEICGNDIILNNSKRIILSSVKSVNISASEIRLMISQKRSVKNFLTKEAFDYIERNNLFI